MAWNFSCVCLCLHVVGDLHGVSYLHWLVYERAGVRVRQTSSVSPTAEEVPHGQPLRYLDRYRDGADKTYGIY
ncbi:hypothetical protein G5714_012299 [Onychostoma macrolepis]|uniref:Secreted protein n=1 Tax=Onychostoma macrolepis TaxID=369639 RepID=A0A7J6CG71_9TELE|nr:hypothetical protein G5714_012299 [Onychostoma macrolepis]